jgi:hypothetical protein
MQEKSAATPSSRPHPAHPDTSPCDPLILDQLQQATRRSDVAALLRRHDATEVNAAWRQLSPLERSSLLLCKHFDGTIIPGYTDTE